MLLSLFLGSLLASTLLPGGSEVLLSALLIEGSNDYFPLWLVATAGNTIGGIITWYMGYIAVQYQPQKWANHRYQRIVNDALQRWGPPALLLSWIPIIGDPICFTAGWYRTPMLASLVFIGIGKALRYAAIILLFHWGGNL